MSRSRATHIGQRVLAMALVLTFTLLGASNALGITRPTVLTRAQSWVDHPVVYSQAKYHLGYRTDCSGYVSMCWDTGTSWATASFSAVTHSIKASELKPGDAMLKKGYHIRLFHHWVDGSHTSYVAYEAGSMVAVVRVHSLSSDLNSGYVPTRYNGILDGPAANNVIWNGSFDAWSGGWSGNGDPPVSWNVSGARWETLVTHRTDVYRTGHNALQLLNASSRPSATPTELSQIASVTAGGLYQLSCWTRDVTDPSGLTLSVTYLDAAGGSLAETSTTGEAWGAGGSAWRQMSAMTMAPAGTVNAVVTVRLAGGGTIGGAGTSALLDDVALARPQASGSMKASTTTARRGTIFTLSGSVTPTSSVGARVALYVKAPNGSWKRFTRSPVTAAGTSAVWRATFAFKTGMRKGVYRFRATVPGFAGYVGTTTGAVGVTFK